mgnify:CR=1 FL=1
MAPVMMIDHRLAGFADRAEIRTFEGVVADEVAVVGLADERLDPALLVQGVDAVGVVEIGIRIGVAVGLVDPPGDLEPVPRAIVADSVFAGDGRRRGLRMVGLGGLVVAPMGGGFQSRDARVGSVGSKVQFRSFGAFLDPPEAIEDSGGSDLFGDRVPGRSCLTRPVMCVWSVTSVARAMRWKTRAARARRPVAE